MQQTFKATRKFRLKILALMLRQGWLAKYGTIIKPEYFEQEDEHDLAALLIDTWSGHKKVPEDPDDILAAMGEEYKEIVYSVFLGAEEWDLDFADATAVQFCKEQAARITVLESLQDIEHGDLAKMHSRLEDAMKVGESINDTGLDLKRDTPIWLTESQTPKIPTGMIHLDIAMEGGLAKGELGVIVSPPNYGKSMALVNIGHGAMGPLSRCKVAHFTGEMAEHIVAKRYGARSIFRFPSRTGSTRAYEKEFKRYAKVFLPGDVRIVRFYGTSNDIRSKVNVLIDDGFKPDVIVIDYGDLVLPIRPRHDAYTELGDIFTELRHLGAPDMFDCPVWTATQSNRSSLGKEVITMEDLADSFKKAAIADAIVAICQTREEEESDQCRLYLAKLRDSKSRVLIRAKYYKEQQAIVTTEFV